MWNEKYSENYSEFKNHLSRFEKDSKKFIFEMYSKENPRDRINNFLNLEYLYKRIIELMNILVDNRKVILKDPKLWLDNNFNIEDKKESSRQIRQEIKRLVSFYKEILKYWRVLNVVFEKGPLHESRESALLALNSLTIQSGKLKEDYRNYVTFVQFSKFVNWEDSKIEAKLELLTNFGYPKDLVKDSINSENHALPYFKINSKVVFVSEEDIKINHFDLRFFNKEDASFLLNKESILRDIQSLISLGYKGMTRVVLGNINEEYEISLKDSTNASNKISFIIKIIGLNNLIMETKVLLYKEDFPDLNLYKNMIIKKDFLEESMDINSIKSVKFNQLNDFYKNFVFIFENISWKEIISKFKSNKIFISSGSNVKKHILNSLDFKLSSLISFVFKEKAYSIVVKSSDKISSYFYKKGILIPMDMIEEDLFSGKIFTKINLKIESNDKFNTQNGNKIDSINKVTTNLELNRKYSTQSVNKISSLDTQSDNAADIDVINKSLLEIKDSDQKTFNDLYFKDIFNIIKDSTLDIKEKQIKIEKFWVNKVMDLNTNKENLDKNLYPKSIKYIIRARETLEIKYKKVLSKKFPYLYEELDFTIVLMITMAVTITLYSRNQINWTVVSKFIGEQILNYVYNKRIEKLIKNSPDISSVYSYDKFLKEIKIEDFNLASVILGDFLLELLCREPHVMFERYRGYDFESSDDSIKYKIKIHESIYEELISNFIVLPSSMPMVCPPLLWSKEKKGGHLLDSYNNDIITGNKSEEHTMNNKENLYKVINILSSMEFTINSDLLRYIDSEEGQNIIKNISGDQTSKSEKLQFYTNLKLAKVLENQSFYLPLKADFRGRIYVSSFYLNYQGSDFSKSLIYLCKGEILNKKGLENLYIYGANLYNEDNLIRNNYDNRIKWVKDNLVNIYDMNINFILKAENVWSFISFCLVMRKIKNNPNSIVKFPIYIDATCSGIQHVALMIKDFDLAKNVNLIKQSREDKVQDIYSMLLKYINQAISAEGNNPKTMFPMLKHVVLTRSEIKLPVMTKTYNVSLIGMKNQLTLSLSKRKKFFIYDEKGDKVNIKKNNILIQSSIDGKIINLDYKDIFKLVQIIESCIFETFPFLKLVYDYFKEITRVLNVLGLPVIWTTPSGIEIVQKYLKKDVKKVNLYFGGKPKKLVLKEYKNEMDKKAQVNAVIPNIVHSLDASHLMEIIKSCHQYGIKYVLPIHDCFGMHPNNLNKVYDFIKLEFLNLYYKEDFLNKFHNFTKFYIKNNGFEIKVKNNEEYVLLKNSNRILILPSVPKTGNLNLKDILKSLYMFN